MTDEQLAEAIAEWFAEELQRGSHSGWWCGPVTTFGIDGEVDLVALAAHIKNLLAQAQPPQGQ